MSSLPNFASIPFRAPRGAEAVAIPVIASLNGSSRAGWIDYAQLIEQAGAAAGRIAALTKAPTAVYASPLERTRETAAPIARALGLRVRTAPGLLEVDVGDLAQRMHAGVGASRAMDGRALAGHGEKRAFKRLLDRKAVLLPLPADERRAVIFEDELKARHSGCLRAGQTRGKARIRPSGHVLPQAGEGVGRQNRLSWAAASLASRAGFWKRSVRSAREVSR